MRASGKHWGCCGHVTPIRSPRGQEAQTTKPSRFEGRGATIIVRTSFTATTIWKTKASGVPEGQGHHQRGLGEEKGSNLPARLCNQKASLAQALSWRLSLV